ncbi:MazG family protein [Curtobacterium sp. MCBD17_040]|uniref:MazG family protein n=1 Tax=Curtobacterium sp. MCBD17_040 TaxID=2175674 RepID=UPI0015E880AB|nr:MazG family protein [Curtobacterium sp. MCBD17_040]WIB62932.1 MazG family protein [Curtobacterium sp. MCBD17_040]
MTPHQEDQADPADRAAAVQALAAVVDRLLAPDGCVWNRAQTHRSLAAYAVEESYELVDAIDVDDDVEIREELGDVLYQVVLHAGIAERRGAFTLADVAEHAREKMVRRHPHVFGDEHAETFADVVRVWRAAKSAEKAARTSVFDGVPRAMPPLERSVKLLERIDEHGLGSVPLAQAVADAARQDRTPGVTDGSDGHGAVDPAWGGELLDRIGAARADGVDPVASLRAAVVALEAAGRATERERSRSMQRGSERDLGPGRRTHGDTTR